VRTEVLYEHMAGETACVVDEAGHAHGLWVSWLVVGMAYGVWCEVGGDAGLKSKGLVAC
jgi:hypothetical protein